MTNQFEIEREFKGERPNHPGYDHPLEFRPLQISDTVQLTSILKKHGKQLSEYLADYTFASGWDFRNANNYVRDLLNAPFPTYSYLFMIGKQIVGMSYMGETNGSMWDAQIVLWVHPQHQGRGIGRNIGYTMRKVILDIWGMNSFNWIVAETNAPSIKTAESLGLELESKFIGQIHAKGETGEWRRYVQFRDETQQGILQGNQSLAGWTGNRNASAIDAILQAQARGDREEARRLAAEELARLGEGEQQQEPVDDRNLYQKAIDQRREELKKIGQKIANQQGRMAYNEQHRKKRKKK